MPTLGGCRSGPPPVRSTRCWRRYVKATSPAYTIATGAGLSFTISRTNADLTSLNYNGTELQASGTNGAHVESGLGSTATVTATESGDYIIVTAICLGQPRRIAPVLTHDQADRG